MVLFKNECICIYIEVYSVKIYSFLQFQPRSKISYIHSFSFTKDFNSNIYNYDIYVIDDYDIIYNPSVI